MSSSLSCSLVRIGGRIKPKVVIPAFPSINCEYDTMRAVERAGGMTCTVVIPNINPGALEASVEELARGIKGAQMIIPPDGFSGSDEPVGSAKFITSFFRNPRIAEATHKIRCK